MPNKFGFLFGLKSILVSLWPNNAQYFIWYWFTKIERDSASTRQNDTMRLFQSVHLGYKRISPDIPNALRRRHQVVQRYFTPHKGLKYWREQVSVSAGFPVILSTNIHTHTKQVKSLDRVGLFYIFDWQLLYWWLKCRLYDNSPLDNQIILDWVKSLTADVPEAQSFGANLSIGQVLYTDQFLFWTSRIKCTVKSSITVTFGRRTFSLAFGLCGQNVALKQRRRVPVWSLLHLNHSNSVLQWGGNQSGQNRTNKESAAVKR